MSASPWVDHEELLEENKHYPWFRTKDGTLTDRLFPDDVELNLDGWLKGCNDFLSTALPERQAYVLDNETRSAVFYQGSLNEIWAYRGQGKSIAVNALVKILVHGGDWLRFRSPGNKKVLLVDGELPKQQLQERLKEFVGQSDQLQILSPELMDNPKHFPALAIAAQQDFFLKAIEPFKPDVIVFDTLTRCFRFDTNDADAWLTVNDFLVRLRGLGYCVILVHHAGKNGTQRGRTDGDDNLDVSIKLDAPYGWQAGDGLAFKWIYEKVRHGGNLPDFEAAYDRDTKVWSLTQDERLAEVMALTHEGKSSRAIATKLDMTQSMVSRLQRKARAAGLDKLNEKIGVSQ